jgi:hypothetical protein
VTIVSPIDWMDREGTTRALAAGPSIIELTKPEANAKKITRYMMLAIMIYLLFKLSLFCSSNN